MNVLNNTPSPDNSNNITYENIVKCIIIHDSILPCLDIINKYYNITLPLKPT